MFNIFGFDGRQKFRRGFDSTRVDE